MQFERGNLFRKIYMPEECGSQAMFCCVAPDLTVIDQVPVEGKTEMFLNCESMAMAQANRTVENIDKNKSRLLT